VFLRDRDELRPEIADRLTGLQGVHLLERRELENYLLEPDAIAQVLESRDPASEANLPIPSEQIEGKLVAAAEGMRNAVHIKMAADRLPPIRLLDRKLINRLCRENADRDALEKAVFAALPPDVGSQVREAWDAAGAVLSEKWAARKLDLAPGADVLDNIWREHGGRYDKRRDGPLIARAMAERPSELVELVDHLMHRRGASG
jgi:hypothetical protein